MSHDPYKTLNDETIRLIVEQRADYERIKDAHIDDGRLWGLPVVIDESIPDREVHLVFRVADPKAQP